MLTWEIIRTWKRAYCDQVHRAWEGTHGYGKVSNHRVGAWATQIRREMSVRSTVTCSQLAFILDWLHNMLCCIEEILPIIFMQLRWNKENKVKKLGLAILKSLKCHDKLHDEATIALLCRMRKKMWDTMYLASYPDYSVGHMESELLVLVSKWPVTHTFRSFLATHSISSLSSYSQTSVDKKDESFARLCRGFVE